MFNLDDVSSLNCFEMENLVDEDFKSKMYPLWNQVDFVVRNQIWKVIELYYMLSTESRITSYLDRSSLKMTNLHLGFAEVTKNLVSEISKCCEANDKGIRQYLAQFAKNIDPSGKIDTEITRCLEPYLKKTEDQRKKQFNDEKPVDVLFWEPSTRDRQPSQYDSTTADNSSRTWQRPELPKLNWSDYKPVHFVSKRSAVVEPAPQIREDEEQVSSVN